MANVEALLSPGGALFAEFDGPKPARAARARCARRSTRRARRRERSRTGGSVAMTAHKRHRVVRFIATSAVAAVIACRANTEESRDFERMRRQQRTAAYQSSRVLASGMSMQLPPRGTISREELLLGPRLVSGKQLGAAGATAFVHDV